MAELSVDTRVKQRVLVRVIDTDVHPAPRERAELIDYLPERWRHQNAFNQVFNAVGSPIYEAPNKAQRLDAYPPGGGAPCSDPEFTERQLFDEAKVDLAILFPLTVRPMVNPEHEAAACAATNEWLADTWLSKFNKHERYYGTLRVTIGDPALAVAEIEKWAGHPRFIQVMINPYTNIPLGQRCYDPIYATAQKYDLPLAIHVNRSPGMRLLTPVGFASYFFEHHSLYPLMYAAHLTSMVMEGVFERFPRLKLVLIEGGTSWIIPLVWRLDQAWRALRSEVPWVKRPPSQIIREHVMFSSQPIDEPRLPREFHVMLELMDAENTLMFATDYPHWDFDDPYQTFGKLPESVQKKILCENARRLYRLPATRLAGAHEGGDA